MLLKKHVMLFSDGIHEHSWALLDGRGNKFQYDTFVPCIHICMYTYIYICISNLEGYIYPLYAYTRKTKKNTNILQIRIRLVDIAAMTPSRSSILETNKYWLVVGPPL